MGGLEAGQPPKDQQDLSPEELHKRWLALQMENERRRAMAMNEMQGVMPAQQDPNAAVSRLLQAIGGF